MYGMPRHPQYPFQTVWHDQQHHSLGHPSSSASSASPSMSPELTMSTLPPNPTASRPQPQPQARQRKTAHAGPSSSSSTSPPTASSSSSQRSQSTAAARPLGDVTGATNNGRNKRKSTPADTAANGPIPKKAATVKAEGSAAAAANGPAAAAAPATAAQAESDGLPFFQCDYCPKSYRGHHARSIWRRHLSDKHGIPLSDQPRRTRWDGDENRPKDDVERRTRTLASKRRWAQKQRAHLKALAKAGQTGVARAGTSETVSSSGGGGAASGSGSGGNDGGNDDVAAGNGDDQDENDDDGEGAEAAMASSSSSSASRSTSTSPTDTVPTISPVPTQTIPPTTLVPSVLIKQEGGKGAELHSSGAGNAMPFIASGRSPVRSANNNGPTLTPMIMNMNTSTSTPLRSRISFTMPAPNFTISRDKVTRESQHHQQQQQDGLSTPLPLNRNNGRDSSSSSSYWAIPESANRTGATPMGGDRDRDRDLFTLNGGGSGGLTDTPLFPIASTPSRITSSMMGNGSPMSVSRYLGGIGMGGSGGSSLGIGASPFSLDHLKPSPRGSAIRGGGGGSTSSSRHAAHLHGLLSQASPTRAIRRSGGSGGGSVYSRGSGHGGGGSDASDASGDDDRDHNTDRDLPPLGGVGSTPSRDSRKEIGMLWNP